MFLDLVVRKADQCDQLIHRENNDANQSKYTQDCPAESPVFVLLVWEEQIYWLSVDVKNQSTILEVVTPAQLCLILSDNLRVPPHLNLKN